MWFTSPFKGTPEALADVLTGRVDYYFCPVNAALPFLKDGRLLGLAVGSTKRSSALPDLPTTVEAGIPDSDYNFWVGMFVPGENLARHRDAAVSGNRTSAALARRAREAGSSRRRIDGLRTRGIQRLPARRDRLQRRAGEGLGAQGAVAR